MKLVLGEIWGLPLLISLPVGWLSYRSSGSRSPSQGSVSSVISSSDFTPTDCMRVLGS